MGDIASGATNQADETQSATENVITMGNMIEETNSVAEALHKNSKQMQESSNQAMSILKELMEVNDQTKLSIDEIYEQTNITNASAQKIKAATDIIASIAEETNLLSLNASIEAARAGESGRGFSVVATQISKLADQSNSTAENVADIIANIIAEADRMVEMMGDVKNKIHEQQKKLDDTMDKSGAVALGVNNSLRDIDTIRNKISVLSQSGDSIQDIVTNLASIAEQNESPHRQQWTLHTA